MPTFMNLRRAWRIIGYAVPAAAILAAAFGLAAPYLAQYRIELDILSNFRLHFAGLLAAGLAGMLLHRHWFAAMLAVIVATPLIIGLKPRLDRDAGPAAAADGEAAFRIVTFNTWHSNDRIDLLETYLRREDADAVVLIEFAADKTPMLDNLLDLYPYRADCIDVLYCHLALLSKRPFEDGGHRMRGDGPPIVWVRYGAELGNLNVVGAHLSRIPNLERQYQQIQDLAKQTLQRGDPIIVAGDFNATEWSLMLNAFQEFSGLWRTTSKPSWPTWFFGLPQIGIDHIFISNGIAPLDEPTVGDDLGSDHLPVSALFAVKVQ
jgi:endonuclease/exonuclease/phosphatase (EEP) superfamily protein YafD